MDVDMKSSGSRWSSISRILVVTTLVLVLLLTVAVSAVIYLAVGQQSSGIAQPEFVRHGILQSYDEFGEKEEESPEEISYFKEDNVVMYSRDNGSFEAQDFNKGILYKKDANSGHCYLLPISTTPEKGHEIEELLSEDNSVTMTGEAERFTVLPGEIMDTSFIPSVVQDECQNGYRWLKKAEDKDGAIVKRQAVTPKVTIEVEVEVEVEIVVVGNRCYINALRVRVCVTVTIEKRKRK